MQRMHCAWSRRVFACAVFGLLWLACDVHFALPGLPRRAVVENNLEDALRLHTDGNTGKDLEAFDRSLRFLGALDAVEADDLDSSGGDQSEADDMVASGSSMTTCERDRELGADKNVFEILVFVLKWNNIGVVLVTLALLLMVCCCCVSVGGWFYGSSADDDDVDTGIGPEGLRGLLMMIYGFIICLVLPVLVAGAFYLSLFLLAKKKVFHMERAILICLPLPTRTVPLGTYFVPFYIMKTGYDVLQLLIAKWKPPDDTVLKIWYATQAIDVYTDIGCLVSMVGESPLMYILAWAATSVISICLPVVAFVVHARKGLSDDVYFKLLVIQFVFEDLPQLVMASLFIFDKAAGWKPNQFMVYSLASNVFGGLCLAKKLYSHSQVKSWHYHLGTITLALAPSDCQAKTGEDIQDSEKGADVHGDDTIEHEDGNGGHEE